MTQWAPSSPGGWSYRPGSWFAVFGDAATLLLPASEKARVVSLWSHVDDGAGFDAVLDLVVSSGLGSLPGFVLVGTGDGPAKILVRGASVTATVEADGETVELDGASAITWVERTFAELTSLRVTVEEPEGAERADEADLPIRGGLVRVARVDLPGVTAPAPAAAPAPAPTVVPAPDEPVAAEPVADDDLVATDVLGLPVDLPPVVEETGGDRGVEADDEVDGEADGEAEHEGAAAFVPGFAPEPSPLDDDADTSNMSAAPPPPPAPPVPPAPVGVPTTPPGLPPLPPPPAWPDDVAAPSSAPPPPPYLGGAAASGPVDEPGAHAEPAGDASDHASDHDGLTMAGVSGDEFARHQPGIPGQPMAPSVTAPVARLVISNGDTVEVDRVVLIGRAPEARRFTSTEQPRLVTVPSPLHEISSTHVEVRPGSGADHGSAVVTDMGSTNGTVLVQPGLAPEDLRPGIPVQLIPGAVVNLGDGVTIQVTRP